MSSENLAEVLNAAARGNEKGYRLFFKETWQEIEPPLTSLTHSKAVSKSIYLSSMISFWEIFVVEKRPLPQNIEGYLFSVCRNTWYAQSKLGRKESAVDNPFALERLLQPEALEEEAAILEETLEYQRQKALTVALEDASEKCKCLFEHHIDKGISLKELVDPLGYPSYQAIVQAKYNCKKRLIAQVFRMMQYEKAIPHQKKSFIG